MSLLLTFEKKTNRKKLLRTPYCNNKAALNTEARAVIIMTSTVLLIDLWNLEKTQKLAFLLWSIASYEDNIFAKVHFINWRQTMTTLNMYHEWFHVVWRITKLDYCIYDDVPSLILLLHVIVKFHHTVVFYDFLVYDFVVVWKYENSPGECPTYV